MSNVLKIMLVFVLFTTSCSKLSKNEEVSENLKGKWNVSSLQVDGEELIVTNVASFVFEFFDFDDALGRYSLKAYAFGFLLDETEGSAEIQSGGTKLILIEDGTEETQNSTITKLTDERLEVNGQNDNGETIIIEAKKD